MESLKSGRACNITLAQVKWGTAELCEFGKLKSSGFPKTRKSTTHQLQKKPVEKAAKSPKSIETNL